MSQKCEQLSYGTCGGILLGFLVTDEIVDTSLTVFVDDLFHVIITDTCRGALVSLTVASNDKELDRELEGIGAAQHPGKLEFCGAFFGVGSRSLERELARGLYLRGKHFYAVKHLGMLQNGNGSLRNEKLARVKAVRQSWYSF